MPGEPRAPDQDAEHIGFAARRGLSLDGHDHAMLRIGGDLRAMHQMLAMPGLVSQLGIGIRARERRRVARDPLRRRPRPGRSNLELRPRRRVRVFALAHAVDDGQLGGASVFAPALAVTVDDGQLGAQALQRRVRLDMRGVNQQPAAADEPRVGALAQHTRKQLLKHRRLREAAALRVTERRVMRQRLSQPEPQKQPDRQIRARRPQQLAHRVAATPRQHQRELDQHDRIKRRTTGPAGHIERCRGRPHRRPVHQPLDTPQIVIPRDQLVQTDHLHLQRLITRPDRESHTPGSRPDQTNTSTRS